MIRLLLIKPLSEYDVYKVAFHPRKKAVRLPQIRKAVGEMVGGGPAGLRQASSGGSEGFWRDGRVEVLLVDRGDTSK